MAIKDLRILNKMNYISKGFAKKTCEAVSAHHRSTNRFTQAQRWLSASLSLYCILESVSTFAQTQQAPQKRVAEFAINQWQSFSKKSPVVRTQADVNRLANAPAEYTRCSVINTFWAKGVQSPPPSGKRSSDTCKWPQVAFYCVVNGKNIPNMPDCPSKQKDNVWDLAPWSAAFISYVFRSTGAGTSFAYSGSHSTYIIEALKNTRGETSLTPKFFGYSINEVAPGIGDLICAPRGSYVRMRFEEIPLSKGSAFHSHCDLVVSVGKNSIELIGGNVGDTVAKTIVNVNQDGRIVVDQPDFRNWFVVIKNRMP